MMFAMSLIPGTAFVVIGYFVLFTSTRSAGTMRRFGQYLAIWIFFLAGAVVLAGLLMPTLGMGGSMMGGMGEHMQRMEQLQEEQLTILRELQG